MTTTSTPRSTRPTALASRTSARTRFQLAAGTVVAPVFLTTGLVQAGTREGFDLERHALSQLALGPGGAVQILNFLLAGTLLLVAARGVRTALGPGPGAVWGPRLLAGFGVGMLIAGVFVADPAHGFPVGTPDGPGQFTVPGMLHALGFAVAMLSWVAACTVLARALAARGDRPASILCVAALPAAAVLGATPALGAFGVRIVLVSAVQLGIVALVCARLARRS